MYKFEKKKEKNLNKLKPSAKGKLTLTLWKGGYFIVEFYPLECMLLTDQEGQLSVSGERMCTILVNRLED